MQLSKGPCSSRAAKFNHLAYIGEELQIDSVLT